MGRHIRSIIIWGTVDVDVLKSAVAQLEAECNFLGTKKEDVEILLQPREQRIVIIARKKAEREKEGCWTEVQKGGHPDACKDDMRTL